LLMSKNLGNKSDRRFPIKSEIPEFEGGATGVPQRGGKQTKESGAELSNGKTSVKPKKKSFTRICLAQKLDFPKKIKETKAPKRQT